MIKPVRASEGLDLLRSSGGPGRRRVRWSRGNRNSDRGWGYERRCILDPAAADVRLPQPWLPSLPLLLGSAAEGVALASFPGTPGKIVFSGTGGIPHPGIVTINLDGSHEHVLHPEVGASAPSYSPDGRQIVFAHCAYAIGCVPGQIPGTAIMNADGSNLHPVTSGHRDSNPAFSPNGNRIVFDRTESGKTDIYTVKLNGSGDNANDNAPVIQNRAR